MIFQISGVVLGLAGWLVIYQLKEDAGKEHIATWHALFGLLALILSLIQLTGGLPLVYPRVRLFHLFENNFMNNIHTEIYIS